MKINKTALAWLLIVLGGFLQIGWSIGVDYSESFTNITWDIITIIFLFFSMICLSYPIRMGLPFTTAYAVWIGIGVVCTVAFSSMLGLESINLPMVLCLAIVLGGVIGLKMTPAQYRE